MPGRRLSYVTFISCGVYLVLTLQRGATHAQLHTSTREHVVKNYEKRREQLKKLVAQTKEQLEDHNNGRNLLEDEEYNRLTKRIPLYEKKVCGEFKVRSITFAVVFVIKNYFKTCFPSFLFKLSLELFDLSDRLNKWQDQ